MASQTALSYSSISILPGVGGIDLRRDPEYLDPAVLARMTNVTWGSEGELISRAGLTEIADTLAGAGVAAHSSARLDDPLTGGFTRFWGAGTSLYRGQSGTVTELETGFSGAPYIALEWRPNLAARTYLYIADGAKMRKATLDGAASPLGLTKPATAVRAELATGLKIAIDDFDDASSWTANNGGGAASAADDTSDKKEGSGSVAFTAGVGSATEGFNCYFAKALSLDLTSYGTPSGGTRAAGDEDNFHLWMHVDKPNFLQEVRLYFVVSDDFDATVIPGTDASANKDAYMRSIRASDATSLIELEAAYFEGGEDKVKEVLLQQNLDQQNTAADPATTAAKLQKEQDDASRRKSIFLSPGRGQWTELGVAGRTMRRSSFIRIGNDTSRGWHTVTGIVVAIRTITDETVIVKLDDLYLHGGYGPDTSEVGSVAMDWRYINYQIKTGARSNPSPEMAEEDYLDPVRQGVRLFPEPYGDADVRQRFYRRGGTNGRSAWFLVGQNSADGFCGIDIKTDLEIQLAAQLETDNDQPVTTEDNDGNEILAQPLNAIWGPHNQIIFGCGDPYRPGHLYWSKYGEPDSWPSSNNEDVCSPDEQLMMGAVFGGQSYVFSRLRGFSITVRIQGNLPVVTVSPTTIGRGLISRYAIAVGREGIYFVARDGVYRTRGGAEEPLAEERLQPLFRGLTVNGYAPINFDRPDRIQLDISGSDLHFIYLDTAGLVQHWVYDIFLNRWRHNSYAQTVQSISAEPRDDTIIIGATAGKFFLVDEAATSDDGQPIVGLIRTGAFNQGTARARKQYGDITWEADRDGETLTVTPYLDNNTRPIDPETIDTGAGRQHYILDPFHDQTDENKKGRDCAIEVTWSSTAGRPRLYTGILSYIILPDEEARRVTDWDFGGRGTDKFYKGVEIECDTRGVEKRVDIEVDGKKQETLNVRTDGRQSLHLAFPQFRGRLVRLHPQEKDGWEIYRVRWIFDEEPLQLPLWATQFTDHGIPGYHSIQAMHLAWRSVTQICVDITSRMGNGNDVPHQFFLPSTNDEVYRRFVTPPANKGQLHRYVFSSEQPFWLYREESFVLVSPWGIGDPAFAHPFGNDNLDQTRGMAAGEVLARRSGGGRLGEDLK